MLMRTRWQTLKKRYKRGFEDVHILLGGVGESYK